MTSVDFLQVWLFFFIASVFLLYEKDSTRRYDKLHRFSSNIAPVVLFLLERNVSGRERLAVVFVVFIVVVVCFRTARFVVFDLRIHVFFIRVPYVHVFIVSSLSFRVMTAKAIALGVSACGVVGFLGYCIYFDRKRRSAPDFKKKLHESES